MCIYNGYKTGYKLQLVKLQFFITFFTTISILGLLQETKRVMIDEDEGINVIFRAVQSMVMLA